MQNIINEKESKIEKLILERFLKENKKEVLFLCVGSNSVIGDSVGPRVGSILNSNSSFKYKVLGDMLNPINANNVFKYEKLLENKYIIAVDSALGRKELIGKIFINNKKIKFGNALEKESISLGDISIKACISKDLKEKHKNYSKLKNVDFEFINNMSKKIANLILGVNE